MTAIMGYKTYILCGLAIIYAISGFFTGHLDSNSAIETIFAALGTASLRHGITTQA